MSRRPILRTKTLLQAGLRLTDSVAIRMLPRSADSLHITHKLKQGTQKTQSI